VRFVNVTDDRINFAFTISLVTLIIACGRRAYTHTRTRINSRIEVLLFVSDALNALHIIVTNWAVRMLPFIYQSTCRFLRNIFTLFLSRESNVTRLWLFVFEYLIASTWCLKYLMSGRLGIVPIDVLAALIIPCNALNGRGVYSLRPRENQMTLL